MDSCFYVYTYAEPTTGDVFYVGKGHADRSTQHIGLALKGKRGFLYSKLRRMLHDNEAPTISVVAHRLFEHEAFALERHLIHVYGRRVDGTGPLCNIALGGQGARLDGLALLNRGKAISEGLKGKPRPPSAVAKVAEAKKEWYLRNPDARAKSAATLAAHRDLPEVRAKQKRAVSAASKGRIWSDDARRKLSESCKGRVYGRDVLDRMAAAKRKPVYCSNGVVYDCAATAAGATGVGAKSVWRVCNGKCGPVKGLLFSYERTCHDSASDVQQF